MTSHAPIWAAPTAYASVSLRRCRPDGRLGSEQQDAAGTWCSGFRGLSGTLAVGAVMGQREFLPLGCTDGWHAGLGVSRSAGLL